MALDFETFETDKTFRAPPEGISWKKISSPGGYGQPWHCAWFRASFHAPAGGTYPLYLRVIPNADSLAFIDGKPAGAFNAYHKKVKVPADGREHTLHLEAYAGHPYPGCHSSEGASMVVTIGKVIGNYPNVFTGGALVERIEPVYSLYYDIKCLFELAKTLDNNSLRKARILKELFDAVMGIHFASTGNVLEEEARAAQARIAPLLAARNGPTVPEIHLIGHAHIDHAWLWHIGETERKVARTFMNMTALSQEYPDFVFIQSQPCQLEIVKNEYPGVFAAVQDAYRRGNWEPNGGMWVEADCNISGGESLVRQFLVGKATNRELLGADSDTLWLPDVFGYAAALPQILSGCGIRYFVTSKINWNDTTRFPYDTFIWRGIDGTGIKTHYIASRTEGYNGKAGPGSLAEIWNEIQHKEIQSGVIKSIGEGDGGGGTTRGDLEMARRLKDLEGAPKAAWRTVSSALDRIFEGDVSWPEWRGELYLELHRGTYTTQARTKRYNRRLEFALRSAELLASVDALENAAPYPRQALLANWKLLLTNQFHDIIPGSSIRRVYVEAEETYRKISASLDGITGAIRGKIAKKLAARCGGGVTVFNSLSWERHDSVAILAPKGESAPTALRAPGDAAPYPVQRSRDLDDNETLVFTPTLPPLGWAHFIPADAQDPAMSASPFVYAGNDLTTPFYAVRFDEAGRIISLKDRALNREFVASGGAFNSLVSAEDVPVYWEAWDIDSDWTRRLENEERLLSTEVVSDGPVCIRIRRKYRIGAASQLTQDTVFYVKDRRIDFETKVDWRERQRLLKAGFDTALDAAQVRCEVQYGHLLRNTHRNLPQDRAKFEICAHKWICLEEGGEGAALLNDCKYGHDVSGGSMRITLLRSPTAPDEEADQGEHRFTYSLLPFSGGFGASSVVRAGYELNDPAQAESTALASRAASPKDDSGASYSLFSVNNPAVIAECVKAPEAAAAGAMVIRLYESLGARTGTTLRFCRELAGASEVNMLETGERALPINGRELELDLRAFEIKTILVRFQNK
jgi:alpha-mannosidase